MLSGRQHEPIGAVELASFTAPWQLEFCHCEKHGEAGAPTKSRPRQIGDPLRLIEKADGPDGSRAVAAGHLRVPREAAEAVASPPPTASDSAAVRVRNH